MTTKKYTSRGSPPYPANECRDELKIGNDGQPWVSVKASNGVYRWKASSGSPSMAPARSSTNEIRELQHKVFYLAVKVGLMSSRNQDPISYFTETRKKNLLDSIQFFENYIEKNEYNEKLPTKREVVKEMKLYLKLDGLEGGSPKNSPSKYEGGSFGSLVGNSFINGAIGNAVAGRTGALIGVGLAATGRGFIKGGSPKSSPNKWIARAVSMSKKGRFAAKAERAGMTTSMFACHVLKNKLEYSLQTCREAQMYVNMNRSRRC